MLAREDLVADVDVPDAAVQLQVSHHHAHCHRLVSAAIASLNRVPVFVKARWGWVDGVPALAGAALERFVAEEKGSVNAVIQPPVVNWHLLRKLRDLLFEDATPKPKNQFTQFQQPRHFLRFTDTAPREGRRRTVRHGYRH